MKREWERSFGERDAMTLRIEDYALIGDCKTAALVGRDGSIDWLCWPRFDSAACFAALLGNADNGRWLIAPKDSPLGASRRYRPGTLVLETEFQTETGSAAVIDFMHPADGSDLVRIVAGRSGRIVFKTELVARFNYGSTVPWVNRIDDGSINAIAGPERLLLRTLVALYGEDLRTVGEFAVEAGQSIPFVLSYGVSFHSPPAAIDGFDALARTEAFWREWSDHCPDVGPWTDAAILVPAAFFLSVLSPYATAPNVLIYLAYIGAVLLAVGVLVLGIGLVRDPAQS
jgi:GH15 family glucan-1,4-alpha-glucosidase